LTSDYEDSDKLFFFSKRWTDAENGWLTENVTHASRGRRRILLGNQAN